MNFGNIYDKNPSQENEIIYKTHHNKMTTLMRTAEQNYYEEQLDLNNYNLSLKICNTFNKYSIEICPKLARKITSLTSPMSHITDSIFIPEISHVEVRNVVLTLRNSSPGIKYLLVSINLILISILNHLHFLLIHQ